MKIIKKLKWFILGLIIIIVLIIIYIGKDLLYTKDGVLYGNRLEDIEKYPVDDKIKNDVIDSFKKNSDITKVNINVHGKIINIVILVNEIMNKDTIKQLASESLSKFSDDIKGYYDISFLIDYANKTENKEFPIIGSKSKNTKDIVW